MSKKFVRKVEDFICVMCGTKVKGTGYTDHCPNCLYSKHVDVNPGDRMADCGGLMKPVGIIKEDGLFKIQYICHKCGYKRQNKTDKEDNFDLIIKLSSS